MNLVNKLTMDYEKCVDIINPFFFNIKTEEPKIPVNISTGIIAPSYIKGNRSCIVELSANPDNIKSNMTDIKNKKELMIFNRGQLFMLQDINSIDWILSNMTGCIEFKIECRNFIIGGNNE